MPAIGEGCVPLVLVRLTLKVVLLSQVTLPLVCKMPVLVAMPLLPGLTVPVAVRLPSVKVPTLPVPLRLPTGGGGLAPFCGAARRVLGLERASFPAELTTVRVK